MAPLRVDLPVLVVKQGRLIQQGSTPFAVHQTVQILTVGDFCNECGNCDSFCPTSGAPYREKPHFWIDPLGFDEAPGDAYRMEHEGTTTVIEARLGGRMHVLRCSPGSAEYRTPDLCATFDPASWTLLRAEALIPLEDGQSLDLAPLGTLVALLPAASVLPPPLHRLDSAEVPV
jgi:putative selenate reductase